MPGKNCVFQFMSSLFTPVFFLIMVEVSGSAPESIKPIYHSVYRHSRKRHPKYTIVKQKCQDFRDLVGVFSSVASSAYLCYNSTDFYVRIFYVCGYRDWWKAV